MERWYKKGAALAEEVLQTQTGADEAAVWFIGQCGMIVKYLDKVLMIDPVLNDIADDGVTVRNYAPPFGPDGLKVDYVFCTHGHIDHLAGETVSGIEKAFPDVKIVIPVGCKGTALGYGIPEAALVCVADGGSADLGNIRVTGFSAAHPEHVLDEKNPDMALGYSIALGKIRLVHLGDTYLTERLLNALEKLGKINILLPPINGDDRFRAMRNCIGNMEAEEAAKLVVHLGADLTIPTHYDMIVGNTVDPLRFSAELRSLSPAAKWKIPALGERVIYKL